MDLHLSVNSFTGLVNNSFPIADFALPPIPDRPKFRYWFPDASISTEAIQNDIKAIHAAGGGGLEFLSFYNYGQGPPLTDWSKYGFGTPAFKDLLYTALNTSGEYGMVFDFAFGPNQGQGVPSAPETPGLALELIYGSARVQAGATFNGALPAGNPHFNYEPLAGFINPPLLWGDNHLVAVVAAEVFSSSTSRGQKQTTLRESSVVDLTKLVKDGGLSWTAPAGARDYELFAFYERYTNEKNCISVDNATTPLGNGSWMVDHFSAAGAQRLTGFWDDNLLNDAEIKQLLKKAGGYSWEDSMEMMASLWWTTGFLDKFQKARGYSAVPCLPVVFQANNMWNNYKAPYNETFIFDTDSAADGGQCNQDYRATLNEGYQDYLRHLQDWAVSLGIENSAQPAYNLPLDMMADVPLVGAPELESMGFGESIDRYRQMAGPAHISRRNVISTEIGAKAIGAYALAVPKLLSLIKESYAGGVNTMVVHGFPYDGDYPGTTWPGYTPFMYEFSDMWGPRMPAWRHLNDSMLYAGRNTHVTKLGVPKVDLGFYLGGQTFAGRDVFSGDSLRASGYTHEYLGATNLVSPEAQVSNGVLAPDGPGYKALVLYNQAQITPEAAGALVDFADKGLPIFIVGRSPNITIGKTGQRDVSMRMGSLLTRPNVRAVSLSNFTAQSLADAGVTPRTAVVSASPGTASQLYSVWRSDNATGTEAVYLYNRGPAASFTLALSSSSQGAAPWVLDAWTGRQTPLAMFEARNGSVVVVELALQQGQTGILALAAQRRETAAAAVHATRRSASVAEVRYNSDGRLEALVRDEDDQDDKAAATVVLSNGTTVAIARQPRVPDVAPGPWNLTIESYAPQSESPPAKRGIYRLPPVQLQDLVAWPRIPGLQNVSGVGIYTTTLQLPGRETLPASHAVLLHLGPVSNTIRAWVNGNLAPPLDPVDAVADISALVVPGANELRVEVSSTLFNAVKARLGSLRTATGTPRKPEYYTRPGFAEYGLVGPVVVQFLRRVTVA